MFGDLKGEGWGGEEADKEMEGMTYHERRRLVAPSSSVGGGWRGWGDLDAGDDNCKSSK